MRRGRPIRSEMTGLLGIGVLVMIVANAVVGTRLVRLAHRTRQLPELAIAASMLLLGAIGYPLSIVARNLDDAGAAETLLGAAFLFENVGCAAMALATWRTFRSEDAWARWLCVAFAALLAGSWLAQAATGDFAPGLAPSPWYWLAFGGRSLPFVWAAFESWSYFSRLRRRAAIGLADPVVADRFRLWAINTSSVSAAFGVFALAVLLQVPVATSPPVLAATSAAGLASGISMWLAFLPPRWYLRRFETFELGVPA
jgi:hypothetical protein